MLLKWKNNKSDYIFTFIVYASVVLISLLILYPLLFVVIASVSDPDLVASGQVLFWPKGITLEGYRYIFRDQRIWSGYYNTIRYTFFGTLIALTITIPAGYALSRTDMAGRGFVMKLLIVTKYPHLSGGKGASPCEYALCAHDPRVLFRIQPDSVPYFFYEHHAS